MTKLDAAALRQLSVELSVEQTCVRGYAAHSQWACGKCHGCLTVPALRAGAEAMEARDRLEQFHADVLAGCDIQRGDRLFRQQQVVVGVGLTNEEVQLGRIYLKAQGNTAQGGEHFRDGYRRAMLEIAQIIEGSVTIQADIANVNLARALNAEGIASMETQKAREAQAIETLSPRLLAQAPRGPEGGAGMTITIHVGGNVPQVYLAGLINTDCPDSLLWREEATGLLADKAIVLSPLRGKGDLEDYTRDGGLTTVSPSAFGTPKDCILRDYLDVEQCDFVLVHLDTFGSARPLCGTLFEVAWAWVLKKPVVAIAAEDNTFARTHPFLVEAVGQYFSTVEAACSFLNSYWLAE